MSAGRMVAAVAAVAAGLVASWAGLCVWAVTADADAELYERDDLP